MCMFKWMLHVWVICHPHTALCFSLLLSSPSSPLPSSLYAYFFFRQDLTVSSRLPWKSRRSSCLCLQELSSRHVPPYPDGIRHWTWSTWVWLDCLGNELQESSCPSTEVANMYLCTYLLSGAGGQISGPNAYGGGTSPELPLPPSPFLRSSGLLKTLRN